MIAGNSVKNSAKKTVMTGAVEADDRRGSFGSGRSEVRRGGG